MGVAQGRTRCFFERRQGGAEAVGLGAALSQVPNPPYRSSHTRPDRTPSPQTT